MRVIAAALVLLSLICPSFGAVTVVAYTNSIGENGAAISRTDEITTDSGTNLAEVCTLGFSGNPGAITSVTFNSVAMTQIGTTVGSSSEGYVALFGLINPSVGVHEPTAASWTNSVNSTFQCTEFAGVNQSGGNSSFANFNSAPGSNSSPSVSITTVDGDGVMDSSTNEFHGYSSVTPTTLMATVNGVSTAYAASNGVSIGTSVSITWSLSGSSNWIDAGVDVVQAEVATNVCTLPIMGVGKC